jgi:colanic acid biosynthesis glycosyl transferase WcaI
MRIGFVTQWYEPETGAAAHPTVIAEALKNRGHEVRVVTGFPNYPAGRIDAGYQMGFRAQRDRLNGIDIVRVPLVPSHDDSAVRRGVAYLSFALSSLRASGPLSRCDVVLVYATPATAALAALAVHAWRGVPFVLYVQDLWPDSVTASGFIRSSRLSRATESLLHHLCDATYRRAEAVLTIAPGMRDRVIARGIQPARVRTVYNWVDETLLRPTDPDGELARSLPGRERFTIMYAGAMGPLQQLDTAILAMAQLIDLQDVHLVLVGEGVTRSRLEALSRDLGQTDRVTFVPPRPLSKMAATLSVGDVQLVSLRDVPLLHSTIPSKLQACMATGRPILCAAPGDAADLVAAAGCGEATHPGDPASLAGAIRRLRALTPSQLRALGESGRSYYLDQLSQAHGVAALEESLLGACRVPQGTS